MTAHRADIGTVRDPHQAGNPLRLEVTARTDSGHVGSLSVIDLTNAQEISYALFNYRLDNIIGPAAFTLYMSSGGIVVTSAIAGAFSIHIPQSLTSLWSGRDWHICRYRDVAGANFDLFDGFVVSTRALSFLAVGTPEP